MVGGGDWNVCGSRPERATAKSRVRGHLAALRRSAEEKVLCLTASVCVECFHLNVPQTDSKCSPDGFLIAECFEPRVPQTLSSNRLYWCLTFAPHFIFLVYLCGKFLVLHSFFPSASFLRCASLSLSHGLSDFLSFCPLLPPISPFDSLASQLLLRLAHRRVFTPRPFTRRPSLAHSPPVVSPRLSCPPFCPLSVLLP
eukprot:6178921-Pleurochrysis_carterae.AAC.1